MDGVKLRACDGLTESVEKLKDRYGSRQVFKQKDSIIKTINIPSPLSNIAKEFDAADNRENPLTFADFRDVRGYQFETDKDGKIIENSVMKFFIQRYNPDGDKNFDILYVYNELTEKSKKIMAEYIKSSRKYFKNFKDIKKLPNLKTVLTPIALALSPYGFGNLNMFPIPKEPLYPLASALSPYGFGNLNIFYKMTANETPTNNYHGLKPNDIVIFMNYYHTEEQKKEYKKIQKDFPPFKAQINIKNREINDINEKQLKSLHKGLGTCVSIYRKSCDENKCYFLNKIIYDYRPENYHRVFWRKAPLEEINNVGKDDTINASDVDFNTLFDVVSEVIRK
jgi:hypothetical protein